MKTTPSPRIAIPRIFADIPLHTGAEVDLPENAVRHIQVLRMQPGQQITLFNGQPTNSTDPAHSGIIGQWAATIIAIGRNRIHAHIGGFEPVTREPRTAVTLLIGIPANERMDFLVEKATELGVYAIYPLIFERSVIRLNAERSAKKRNHWQAITIAACEQCGGNRIPVIHPVMHLQELLHPSQAFASPPLKTLPADRRLLSLNNTSPWPGQTTFQTNAAEKAVAILSGPEGGLATAEEQQLIEQAGFIPYSLGCRTLRADTAPLAALSTMVLEPPLET